MKHVHVIVTGRVQGVSYRAWTEAQAEELGVSGWVRNRADGTVEAVLAGPDPAVNGMLERMRQGPRAARVADLRVTDAEGPAPAPEGFATRA